MGPFLNHTNRGRRNGSSGSKGGNATNSGLDDGAGRGGSRQRWLANLKGELDQDRDVP